MPYQWLLKSNEQICVPFTYRVILAHLIKFLTERKSEKYFLKLQIHLFHYHLNISSTLSGTEWGGLIILEPRLDRMDIPKVTNVHPPFNRQVDPNVPSVGVGSSLSIVFPIHKHLTIERQINILLLRDKCLLFEKRSLNQILFMLLSCSWLP